MRTAFKPVISHLASFGLVWLAGLLVLIFALSGWPASLIAQRSVTGFEAGVDDPAEARAALARATKAQADAAKRAEQFTAEADKAGEALDKTRREAAALAARIQQAEAQIAATNARLVLIGQERRALNARLAVRQRPLVRLTGALQNMARRPLALSALRPGSLKDTVYVRAVLDSTVPQVRARTADLRKDIERGQQLERNTNAQLAKLQGGERLLGERRTALAAISRNQQVTSRQASGIAVREKERALALAEEARDLDALVGKLGEVSALREELAALSGPVVRPAQPNAAGLPSPSINTGIGESETPTQTGAEDGSDADTPKVAASAPLDMQLHVQGRTITGFGEKSEAGVRSTGVVIAPSSGAQVVAPAGGRVAFSGPYKGFGRIIIIEHATGWTSLITGLARSDVDAGAQLARGSPLGVA
ncbi:MAG: peptidoglycan DD-metalloendopeptidase family protein, partial [Marinomonas sp.]